MPKFGDRVLLETRTRLGEIEGIVALADRSRVHIVFASKREDVMTAAEFDAKYRQGTNGVHVGTDPEPPPAAASIPTEPDANDRLAKLEEGLARVMEALKQRP